MSYLMRKNYFKDYFWQSAGNHQTFVGVPPTNPLDRYDNKSYWYDFINAGSPWRWYIAELKATTKFYATTNHEYDTFYLPTSYTNKMGLFVYTGATVGSVANPVQICESAAEIPPDAARSGFLGQYGASQAIQYTGTIYEYAMAWTFDTDEGEEPSPVLTPSGITIYANTGAGGDGDGLHVVFVPVNSFLNMKNPAGTWTQVTGPAICVCKGACNNAAAAIDMVLISSFSQYNNGNGLVIMLSKEYFARIEYWPEPRKMKRIDVDDPNTPNLDRRVRIYFSDDKKKLGDPAMYVGEVSTVDYNYTTAKNYVDMIVFDSYYDYDVLEAWVQYPNHGFIQFDEVVVASEWLPVDAMEVHSDINNKFSYARLAYTKDENELTHTYSSTTKPMPSLLIKDQVEVYSRCETVPILYDMEYLTDFNVAFADGWTVTDTTGAHQQQARYTGFDDQFTESYTNKGNDTNWSVTVGTWDTSTTSGWLYCAPGAAGTITTTAGGVDNDFVFDTRTNLTIPSDTMEIYFGLFAVNTSIRVQISATAITVAEHAVGTYQTRITHNTTMTGTHTIKIIRTGAFIKLYVDGTYAGHGELISTACSTDLIRIDKSAALTVLIDYVTTSPPFPNGYAYMTNVGNSSQNVGDIYRSVAAGSDTGEFEIVVWEAFDEGTADGQFFIKLHYDNGAGGTNWLGLQFTYTYATTTKALTLYHDSATSKAITVPSSQDTVNIGYTEHKYRIFWNVDSGNITQVAVYSMTDGQFLGTYTGISEAYAGNMRVEIETNTTDNCEPPYFGMCQFVETPTPTTDIVEVPVFHGEVRHIRPVDSDGFYSVMVYSMIYPLCMMKSWEAGPTYYPESSVDDETLYTQFLLENGNTYWRWLHFWNFNVTGLPGTWFPHRRRGYSALDVLTLLSKYSGLNFQSTPEMQFIVDEYYRDFWGSDILELSTIVPEGLFLDASSLTYFNQSQTNYVMAVARVDDASRDARMGDITIHPASFQWPADATDVTWNGAAHAAPSMTSFAPTNITGNLGTIIDSSGQDIIEATINSDDSQSAANTTAFLTSYGNNLMKTYSHKNQVFAITLMGSKQWFRPMDKIEVKVGLLDPTLENVVTVVYDDLYVIQSAHHICHENAVTYIVGRIEIYDDGGDVVGVDGFGPPTDPQGRRDKTRDIAWDALGQGLQ